MIIADTFGLDKRDRTEELYTGELTYNALKGRLLDLEPFGASLEDLTVLGALSMILAKKGDQRGSSIPQLGMAPLIVLMPWDMQLVDMASHRGAQTIPAIYFPPLILTAAKDTISIMTREYSLPKLAYGLKVSHHSGLRTLTDLPQDLEPAISGQIMDLHYNKHHQTYITNLNNALKTNAQASSDGNLVRHLELQQAIKFNAGGHVNHTLFWENLTPPSSSKEADAPDLQKAIQQRFKDFKADFEAVALGLQGSGWVWLVKDGSSGILDIITSKDQDIVPNGKIPIIGLDMW